jgi:hypothetical protein
MMNLVAWPNPHALDILDSLIACASVEYLVSASLNRLAMAINRGVARCFACMPHARCSNFSLSLTVIGESNVKLTGFSVSPRHNYGEFLDEDKVDVMEFRCRIFEEVFAKLCVVQIAGFCLFTGWRVFGINALNVLAVLNVQ